MIPNQPYVPQSNALPEFYPHSYMSTNHTEMNKPVESENAPISHCYYCVDISHMHDSHYMHDFHPMHHYDPMHDFHPMDYYHPMYDSHPAMHELWHPDMHAGWEFTSLDYHHEWFHPYLHPHHMHYMHHPIYHPVICFPVEKGQQVEPK